MRLSHNNCIHQSDRPVTGLACASPAPARTLVMQGVRPISGLKGALDVVHTCAYY
jgi:hypothetical protein